MRPGRLPRLSRVAAETPRPLVALLATTILLGAAWATLVPFGQAPDEPMHFAYAQSIAEDLQRPAPDDGDNRDAFSSEQRLASNRSAATNVPARLAARPEWSKAAEARWRRDDASLPGGARSDGGGPNTAAENLPLYYAYESIPYWVAGGGGLFDRWYLMRLWSLLLQGVAVIATWLLVGEIVGREPLLQLAGAACVGLQPMASFVSASVNPDAALVALWALALWLGVRVLRRGPTRATLLALVATAVAAILVKPAGFALLAPVAVVAAVVVRRRLVVRRTRPAVLAAAAIGAALLLAVVGLVAADTLSQDLPQGSGGVRRFASYLWQFYLPELPFQEKVTELSAWPAYDVWLKTSWAAFGWLEVRLAGVVYVLIAAVLAAVAAGFVLALWRKTLRLGRLEAVFLGVAALALLAGLHWYEFYSIADNQEASNQGRYLLPLAPLLGVAVAGALTPLRTAWRGVAAGALIGGLLVLQLASLGAVAVRYFV